jgi:hypothetical protein
MRTRKKRPVFKFQPFSCKQRMVLNWWTKNSPVKVAYLSMMSGIDVEEV